MLYTIYTIGNHAFSNSKYIHMRCFKVLNICFFGNYNTMSGRGRRGRPRRVIPAEPERPAVPVGDEHVVCSTTASINQPPEAGQVGPSGPPEGA